MKTKLKENFLLLFLGKKFCSKCNMLRKTLSYAKNLSYLESFPLLFNKLKPTDMNINHTDNQKLFPLSFKVYDNKTMSLNLNVRSRGIFDVMIHHTLYGLIKEILNITSL